MTDLKTDEVKAEYLVKDTHEEISASTDVKHKPVTDLSPRVVRLARLLDRLSLAAKYNILLIKGESKEQRWVIEITEQKEIRNLEL